MNDLEVMRKDLVELKGKVQAQEAYTQAVKHLLFHTTQLLHAKGIVRMHDIATSAEGAEAFGRIGFAYPKMELLGPLVQAMRDIGDALDQAAGQPPAP